MQLVHSLVSSRDQGDLDEQIRSNVNYFDHLIDFVPPNEYYTNNQDIKKALSKYWKQGDKHGEKLNTPITSQSRERQPQSVNEPIHDLNGSKNKKPHTSNDVPPIDTMVQKAMIKDVDLNTELVVFKQASESKNPTKNDNEKSESYQKSNSKIDSHGDYNDTDEEEDYKIAIKNKQQVTSFSKMKDGKIKRAKTAKERAIKITEPSGEVKVLSWRMLKNQKKRDRKQVELEDSKDKKTSVQHDSLSSEKDASCQIKRKKGEESTSSSTGNKAKEANPISIDYGHLVVEPVKSNYLPIDKDEKKRKLNPAKVVKLFKKQMEHRQDVKAPSPKDIAEVGWERAFKKNAGQVEEKSLTLQKAKKMIKNKEKKKKRSSQEWEKRIEAENLTKKIKEEKRVKNVRERKTQIKEKKISKAYRLDKKRKIQ